MRVEDPVLLLVRLATCSRLLPQSFDVVSGDVGQALVKLLARAACSGLAWMFKSRLLVSPTVFQLVLNHDGESLAHVSGRLGCADGDPAMPADSERPHDTVRKEHQAFARKLHQIEKDARMLLKGQDPTVQNLVHGIRRDSERATRLKKKLVRVFLVSAPPSPLTLALKLALATMFDRARRMEETGPWEATPVIQGAMFFLFDCLKASDPEQKWYAPEKIGRPQYVVVANDQRLADKSTYPGLLST